MCNYTNGLFYKFYLYEFLTRIKGIMIVIVDWNIYSVENGKAFFRMFNISVDEYFYPTDKVAKSTARRQIETALDLLSDNELKIIQGTIDGILNSRESKK